MRLAGAESVTVQADKTGVPEGAVSAVCESAEAYIPLNELIDVEKERERVQKEMARVQGEIGRAEAKLANEGFVAKAPEKVIAAEREKLETARAMLEKLAQRLRELH